METLIEWIVVVVIIIFIVVMAVIVTTGEEKRRLTMPLNYSAIKVVEDYAEKYSLEKELEKMKADGNLSIGDKEEFEKLVESKILGR